MTILDPELYRYLEQKDFPAIHHPLVRAVPYYDRDDIRRTLNKTLADKKKKAAEHLNDGRWYEYLFLHERFWRANAFLQIQAELFDAEYWHLLSEVWSDAEAIYPNRIVWWELLGCFRQHRESFMTAPDRRALRKLPDSLQVYRGTRSDERDDNGYLGFSWTVDKKVAQWFATRSDVDGTSPQIAIAECNKEDVIGYFSSSDEKEIVVLSGNLQNVEWETVE